MRLSLSYDRADDAPHGVSLLANDPHNMSSLSIAVKYRVLHAGAE